MSGAGKPRRPVAKGDSLADLAPAGVLTDTGWLHSSPAQRARALVRAVPARMDGAASVLLAQAIISEASRAEALTFLAETLRRDAATLRRALAVVEEQGGA